MDMALLQKIIGDVSKWSDPLTEIVPINYGEFFSNKDWEWILDTCCKTKAQIVIPTNGSLLNEEKVSRLCSFPNVKVINFSVNAYFAETYEKFNALPFLTISQIEEVIKVIKIERPDILVRVSMVFDPEYQTDLEKDYFEARWKGIAESWVLPAASCGRAKKPFTPVVAPCRSIFSDFVVGYDGKLSSCCFDAGFKLDLGYYSGDLKADWMNKKLTNLRKIHNEHNRVMVDLCEVCTFA